MPLSGPEIASKNNEKPVIAVSRLPAFLLSIYGKSGGQRRDRSPATLVESVTCRTKKVPKVPEVPECPNGLANLLQNYIRDAKALGGSRVRDNAWKVYEMAGTGRRFSNFSCV
jgi:hypothetical protein